MDTIQACKLVFLFVSLGALAKYNRTLQSRILSVYVRRRTTYAWKQRKQLPGFLRKLLDVVFNVDPCTASVDSPTRLGESIKVVSATLERDDMCIDVTQDLEKIFKKVDKSGYITVSMDDLVPKRTKWVPDWEMDVVYLGHANPDKRIKAGRFAVKYRADSEEDVVFPPYSALESVKRGLGTKRILDAKTTNKDVTDDARMYGGLRLTFYQDVDNNHIVKSYIGHKDVQVSIQSRGKIENIFI